MSRRPSGTAFSQQKLDAWQPKISVNGLIFEFIIIGLVFIPLGVMLLNESRNVREYKRVYDAASGMDVDCSIKYANYGGSCTVKQISIPSRVLFCVSHIYSHILVGAAQITIEFDEIIQGPLYVYYELTNYYQNNRRYIKSTSQSQLLGQVRGDRLLSCGVAASHYPLPPPPCPPPFVLVQSLDYDDVYLDCYPLIENGTQLLNPCGLIANSFFNGKADSYHLHFSLLTIWSLLVATDVIELASAPEGVIMDETSISWPTDINSRFVQVDGFVYQEVVDVSRSCADVLGDDYADCKVHQDLKSGSGKMYYYWYPDDENVQYLHESFPNIVSPIEGVKNEHFINLMRTAGLPDFRKLYGRINSDIAPGDTYVFHITTNFEVASISGSKSIVITTLADYGGQNYALGKSAIIIGVVSLFVGLLFAFKRIFNPRPLGDIRQLDWKF